MAVLYIMTLSAYLVWRFTIINPDSMALSVAFFSTECIGFILGLTAIFTSWHYNHRSPTPAPRGLSVDVLIPTYKEPLGIIRRTVMAARDIEYPHNTFVLDDGKRDDVKEMAAQLGVQYIRRSDSAHAKAGNLNHGMTHSKADFVMTFDADHIALPHAIDAMLGFFDDPSVALVQTPQDYYNIDAFQYMNAERTGALWHDQAAFYNLAESCADSANAASCVGTGVIYRREALDAVGGIPVETVTEDIHTSLKLHKTGYKTVFLNEPVAYGVASADLGEYYKTRHRWGHGNLHALKHENILFCKGLTLRQRLHYLSLGLIYLEGWQQLLLFAIPLIALVTGLQPFTITVFNTLVVLSFPVLSYIMLQEIGCGFARYWANEIFAMARWPVYIISTMGLFGRKIDFLSSSKNTRGAVSWKLMAPQLTVMMASLCALAYGVAMLAQRGFQTGPLYDTLHSLLFTETFENVDPHEVMTAGYTADLVLIAGAWALYSAIRALFFVRKALTDAKKTHDYFRFRLPLPALLGENGRTYACVTSIAEDWVQFTDYRQATPLQTGEALSLTVFMPSGPVRLQASIAKSQPDKHGGTCFEANLSWPSPALQDRLANGLYSVDWHREFLHRNAYFLTPSDLLLRLFGHNTRPNKQHNLWEKAFLYGTPKSSEGSVLGILSGFDGPARTASLVTFQKLATGTTISGRCLSPQGQSMLTCTIEAEEALQTLAVKGLDSAIPHKYMVKAVA